MLEIISSAKTQKVLFEDVIELNRSIDKKINQSIEPVKKTKIYRWVDEKGRVHYSDNEKDKK